MTNFIFNPDSVFSKDVSSTTEDEDCFTVIGYEDFIDNTGNARIKQENIDKIFAKKTLRKNGSIKYLIRLANNGKLYNPVSIYGKETEATFLNRICRSDKKFKEVNEKTFNWYIKFLNTKNTSWLYNAEREME